MNLERGSFMEDPREITVSITDRFFTLDLPIEDEQLIGNVLLGLAQYVKEGSSIKVKEAYMTFSGTEEIMTKVISTTKQVAEWGKEISGLISAVRKRE
jgi:F0F1-type ATP synthase alpha subunit